MGWKYWSYWQKGIVYNIIIGMLFVFLSHDILNSLIPVISVFLVAILSFKLAETKLVRSLILIILSPIFAYLLILIFSLIQNNLFSWTKSSELWFGRLDNLDGLLSLFLLAPMILAQVLLIVFDKK